MPTIPQSFLTRVRFSCRRLDKDAAAKFAAGKLPPEALGSEYSVPVWRQIEAQTGFARSGNEVPELIGRSPKNAALFDFRVGWAYEGLCLTVVVAEKEKQSIFPPGELDHADVLRLCLDTSDVKDARRGSRFCCKFLFYPLVGIAGQDPHPVMQWIPISRAKEHPTNVDVDDFRLASEMRDDGYAFSVFIPGSSLTEYDPEIFTRVGLHYAVLDSEHGAFVLQHYAPFPIEEDPGLWPSFELEGA